MNESAPVRKATVIEAKQLSARLGAKITLVSETLQRTGSFKFRAAYHVASRVHQSRIIGASSGNFGQALAYACRLLGKSCIVVMPCTSARVKIEAVRSFGGQVELVDTQLKSRAARVAELAEEFPDAYVASAYDDPLVIRGNVSLGHEIAALDRDFYSVVVPVGGGGLSSGIIMGLREAGKRTPVIGAEPVLANDAARSLRAGMILSNDTEPQTIADGARTLSLGQHNWAVLRNGMERIVEVPETDIRAAVRLLFQFADLKAEPTGALALAALLTDPNYFRGRKVCCVVSGGNVDPQLFRDILAGG